MPCQGPSRLSERSDYLPAKAIGIIPSFNFHGRLCEIREVRNRLQFSAALGLQANCPAVFSDEAIRQERDNWNREHDLTRSVAQIINDKEWQTMSASGTTWVIVLAAGDGRRLQCLTTNASGMAVPKQFCSLCGGYSLLRDALLRAEAVALPEHICTIVAEQHRLWWGTALGSIAKSNIIVQPRNRGTAHGILLPLLHIMQRDREARIVLLPSDHHVDNERALATAMRRAIRQLNARSRQIFLLGISPERADPDLGYIVPGDKVERNVSAVIRFVEKPSATRAQRLIKGGALWNAFIVAARASALLELFQTRIPQIVDAMRAAVVHDQSNPNDSVATTDLYQHLSDIDFSKQVLEGAESMLRVVPVPHCGWSDLGTPTRLAETLQRLPPQRELPQDPLNPLAGFLNLSLQHSRLQALGDTSARK